MRRLLTTLTLLVLALPVVFGQSKKELIELGDAAYRNENYGSAIYFYKRVVEHIPSKYDLNYPYEIKTSSKEKKEKSDTGSVGNTGGDPRKVYVIHRLAESYRLLRDYQHAEEWYKIATENPTQQFPNSEYFFGITLMHNKKYEEASKVFERFVSASQDAVFKNLAEKKMVACTFALNPESTRTDLSIKELDSNLNKGTSSFAINYFTEESVIFASGREGNTPSQNKEEEGFEKYTSDLYIVAWDGSDWVEPQQFAAPVNSALNEGASVLSIDRSTFYFTRWNPNNKKECNIYVSKRFNRRWMEPMKLDINMDGYKTMHPMLNLDESKLFFVSDRPGGQGGLDIWVSTIDEEGNIGAPENLGPTVNTPEDEVSPFYHFQTNTLYFSSAGHRTYGGLDVMYTKFNEDEGVWSVPMNVGALINSSKDDAHYIIDKNLKKGFFSSDRKECAECDTINDIRGNCYRLYSFDKADFKITLSGYVYNAETDEVIPNALVELKDIDANWDPVFLTTDENGYYFIELQPQMEIFIKAKKTKFFADAASVNTKSIIETTALEQDFFLQPIPTGEIEIPGIEYDFDKATLRPKSKEILDQLYDFLQLNNNLTVEIKSHTDCRGPDAYNKRLSQERAKSCVDYLITKGIDKRRLIPQGYGETEPLFECDDIEKEANKEKQEEMH